MKKVVLFCPSRVWGGIEKNVLLRARFLGSAEVKVTIVLLKGFFADRFDGLQNVDVVEVNSRGGDFNLAVVVNYLMILRKIRPDVVFAALKKDWWLVSLASRLACIPRVILYLGIARRIKSPVKYFLIFRVMKSLLMVNSESLRRRMLDYPRLFGTHNVHRVYNGFELPALDGEALDFRALLGLPEDSFIIGCAGRFSPQKGFDLLPSILARLPDRVHVVHVGEGEYEQEIKSAIVTTPQAERIHFLGYQKSMDKFFRGIDLFMLCSRNEGMANVLNEAMSFGKPVISTLVPGSEELLADGKYGALVAIDDVDAMADAILRILDGEYVLTPSELRGWIEEQFGLEKMIQQTTWLFFCETPET